MSFDLYLRQTVCLAFKQKDEKPQIQINIEKRPRIKPQFESFGFVGQIER